jgi:hypothetical protein
MVAVTVTDPEPIHETVPKVSSGALLTVAIVESETDQTTLFDVEPPVVVVREQLPLMEMPTAENLVELPGGAVVTLSVAD